MTLSSQVNFAIRLEIDPHLMGGRQVIVDDTAHELVVRRIDPSEIDDGHVGTPEITDAMIEAGSLASALRTPSIEAARSSLVRSSMRSSVARY
jgi:hypothetical protein